ncbi:MAG: HAD family hydrolase [Nanoarchaeota archaeon]|nr:HAD family hydrolase [Nanoarchaeota archaeon]
MSIELVIWDYNGTLTDDLPRMTHAVNLFLEEFSIPPATNEEVACYDGDIWKFYLERNIHLPKAEIGARLFEIYSKLSDPLRLMSGAIETLERIDKPQVLVTKHPTHLTEREVDELEIRKYFLQIYSGIRDKTPLFQQLCQERNIPTSNGVIIGDRTDDIKEGKLAGNKVIAIPGYHPKHILEKHSPNYIVGSLWEVYECISKIR